MIGRKFGRWTVLEKAPANPKKWGAYWKCICNCGSIGIRNATALRSNRTLSCGCLAIERSREIKKRNRLPIGESILTSLFSNYRDRARKKQLSFELSRQEFKELIYSNCYYCGSKPLQKVKARWNDEYIYMNGIDRKNSNLGYIKDNIVPCCKTCNYGKRDLSYVDWLDYLNNLIRYRSSF